MQLKINPETCRFSFELKLYNSLLKNKSFKKASEDLLNTISLEHSHENDLSYLTNGVHVNANTSPKLNYAFDEIKKKLRINKRDDVALFINSDSSVNAGCAFIEKNRYVVYLNAGLLNIMNLEEIKFVIGHELGHLKFKHHKIIKDFTRKNPPIFAMRLFEHSRYAEISADRCGLASVSSLSVAKKALLKIASGTDLSLISSDAIELKTQLNSIKKILEQKQGLVDEKLSHPYSLIRLYALEKFDIYINKTKPTDEDLFKTDEKIFSVLSMLNPKMDKKKNTLLINACLWISYSDKANLRLEMKNIEGFCDPSLLPKILEESQLFKNKAAWFKNNFLTLLKNMDKLSLSEKSDILDKVCVIALADGVLQEKELIVIKKISSILGFTKNYVDSVIKKLIN
tara:strand:+ start:7101 stop:8297 length:1197 start_codon:yes stop_codon:yes gene_type:complete